MSAWLARRGARVVGIDNSERQLETAWRLQARHGLAFPLLHGNAETVPLPDASFDFAISEYGASLWADPTRWIPEAARLLRPGGRLVFMSTSQILALCAPADEHQPATERLVRSCAEARRLALPEPDSVEFHRSPAEWLRLLVGSGLSLEDITDVYAPEGASTHYDFVTVDWARRWPCETVYKARRVGWGGRARRLAGLLMQGGVYIHHAAHPDLPRRIDVVDARPSGPAERQDPLTAHSRGHRGAVWREDRSRSGASGSPRDRWRMEEACIGGRAGGRTDPIGAPRQKAAGGTVRLVIDTSVLIDHLRGDSRAADLLVDAVRRGDELWSVTIVRTEILAGMRPREEAVTRRLLDQLAWLEVSIELADRAGVLARRWLRSHPGVDTADYLVAAGTQLLAAELKTQNVKHFPMFPRLLQAY